MREHAALLGFGNDLQSYENKFSGVAQLFFNQAGTARNQVQQNVLLLASNDAIINTAKSVGLDPSAVAWNTAIAEQQFQASMQAQGRMAQTFLPLAKAYLTAIVVGLSWLVALLSIIFANYAYIKMFFTLLLWLTLWTPIIAIINYLNDLNLMKVAQVITEGKTALTMGTNMLIYKKIADNASFMNYLVMSTPVLAYALAKASEQGFVTFASGLSQALQGSSRAAGTFANQQALSTKSEISSPRGDEVWAREAGIDSIRGANFINGITNQIRSEKAFNSSFSTNYSGAYGSGNVTEDGRVVNSQVSGVDVSTLNAANRAYSKTLVEQYTDNYEQMDSKTKAAITSSALDYAYSEKESQRESVAKSIVNAVSTSSKFGKEISGAVESQTQVFAKVGAEAFGTGAGVQTSIGATIAARVMNSKDYSDEDRKSLANTIDRATEMSYLNSIDKSSSQNNSLSHSDSDSVSKALSTSSAYMQNISSGKNINVDSMDNIVAGLAKDNYESATGQSWSSASLSDKAQYAQEATHQIYSSRNDSAQLMALNNQYGASQLAGNKGLTGSVKATHTNFTDVNASDVAQSQMRGKFSDAANLTHNGKQVVDLSDDLREKFKQESKNTKDFIDNRNLIGKAESLFK